MCPSRFDLLDINYLYEEDRLDYKFDDLLASYNL